MWFKSFYLRIDGGVLVLKSILEFCCGWIWVIVEFVFGFGGLSDGWWFEGFDFGFLFGIVKVLEKLISFLL